MLKVDFIFYSDEWNREKPKESSTNFSRMEGSISSTNSDPQSKEV
jgi:hypothetical protein